METENSLKTNRQNETKTLKHFLHFLSFSLCNVYVPQFICAFSTLATYLELQSVKILYDLKKVNAVVAESALNKPKLHLWYFIEVIIPCLSRFDADVPHLRKKMTL